MRIIAVAPIVAVAVLLALTTAEESSSTASVYTVPEPEGALFYETFQSANWKSRWIASEVSEFDGEWSVGPSTAEPVHVNERGLIVGNQAKKHAISATLPKPIVTKDEDLVIQYEVRLNNRLDCGGAYMKLIRQTEDLFTPEEFNAGSDYVIMFGPDKCGMTNKIHFIFKHQNPISKVFEEKHLKNPPSFTVDSDTHLYTLVIRKDNSFEIFVDQQSVKKGDLLTDFDPPVNPPEMIDDPTDSKPTDWVDDAKIPDPAATKPEDWDEDAPRTIPDPDAVKPEGWLDDAPAQIPDPKASKPEDWDDELDGEWEAPIIDNPACEEVGCGRWEPPMIKNPAYKGKWSAPLIDNPAYIGEWKPKQIPNPNYFVDKHPHNVNNIVAVGFELWTMTNGIEFDNIYIGRDATEAHSWAQATFAIKQKAEAAFKKEEEKKIKKTKIESQKKKGFMGHVEAYGEIASDFISENPIPVFFTIVALLVGLVVFFEYRRPKQDEAVEQQLEPEKAKELLEKLHEEIKKSEEKKSEEEKAVTADKSE